jgi:uncharacterized cupredoxin-like copper-binding protein
MYLTPLHGDTGAGGTFVSVTNNQREYVHSVIVFMESFPQEKQVVKVASV